MSGKPIRVVVVDDSRLMRGIIQAALEAEGDIAVAAQAGNVAEGRRMIKETDPDAVTLDVEMPGMNGLEFLEKIMTLRPTPVVMVSSLTAEGTEITLAALQMGAVDVVRKPSGPDPMGPFGRELREKVRTAARAQVQRRAASPVASPRLIAQARKGGATTPSTGMREGPRQAGREATPQWMQAVQTQAADPGRDGAPLEPAPPSRPGGGRRSLIAIGASTGGVGALGELLEGLPPDLPPVVITQHMPEGYTDRFARRLRDKLRRDVAEARDSEPLAAGMVRIAPGSRHLEL
ncbi:MAG: response regulator, partial [Pseudomonadota bacterium]|nr:response regulator [Pseudomonadota bacterium]